MNDTARHGTGEVERAETLAEELARLISEYRDPSSTDSVRGEAWNLIADCVVENADAIAKALSAPAAEGRWHRLPQMPAVGRKFVALYDDGSGAKLIYRHDGGFIDADGDEFASLKEISLWSYLPEGVEFWCETLPEVPMHLPTVAPAAEGCPNCVDGGVWKYCFICHGSHRRPAAEAGPSKLFAEQLYWELLPLIMAGPDGHALMPKAIETIHAALNTAAQAGAAGPSLDGAAQALLRRIAFGYPMLPEHRDKAREILSRLQPAAKASAPEEHWTFPVHINQDGSGVWPAPSTEARPAQEAGELTEAEIEQWARAAPLSVGRLSPQPSGHSRYTCRKCGNPMPEEMARRDEAEQAPYHADGDVSGAHAPLPDCPTCGTSAFWEWKSSGDERGDAHKWFLEDEPRPAPEASRPLRARCCMAQRDGLCDDCPWRGVPGMAAPENAEPPIPQTITTLAPAIEEVERLRKENAKLRTGSIGDELNEAHEAVFQNRRECARLRAELEAIRAAVPKSLLDECDLVEAVRSTFDQYVKVAAEATSLRAVLAAARPKGWRELAQFAQTIIRAGCWDGTEVDGGTIQELALELGLIERTKFDPEKHGWSEHADPGDDWYVFSPILAPQAGEARP